MKNIIYIFVLLFFIQFGCLKAGPVTRTGTLRATQAIFTADVTADDLFLHGDVSCDDITTAGDLIIGDDATMDALNLSGLITGVNADFSGDVTGDNIEAVTSLRGPSIEVSDEYTLPTADATSDGYCMKGHADNTTYWGECATSGGITEWTALNSISRASNSTFTMTHSAAMEELLKKGKVIKFKSSDPYTRYGVVKSYVNAAGTATITFHGHTMAAGYDNAAWVADDSIVTIVELQANDIVFDDAAYANKLEEYGYHLRWNMDTAYLAGAVVRIKSEDTGASETVFRIQLNGENAISGFTPADSWADDGNTITTNSANYTIEYGEIFELEAIKGTNGDAEGVSWYLYMVRDADHNE